MEIRFIPLGFREAASPAVNDLDLLDSEQRYMYSMEQIRKAEEAWTLCAEDGDSIVMDACGKECICLWPNRSAAQHFLQEVPSEDGVPYQVGLKELVRVSKKMAAEAQYAFIVYPSRGRRRACSNVALFAASARKRHPACNSAPWQISGVPRLSCLHPQCTAKRQRGRSFQD